MDDQPFADLNFEAETEEPSVSEHRLDAGRVLTCTWPFVLLGTIALGLGAPVLWLALTRLPVDRASVIGGSVCLVLAAALNAVYFYRLFTDVALVRLHPDGLEWQEGNVTHRASWADIAEVYRKEVHNLQGNARPSDWNRQSRLRLVLRDGGEVSFNHGLSGYNRLATAVQERTRRELLPRLRQEVAAGGAAFGLVRLTPAGLEGNGFADRFGPFVRFEIRNGHLAWHTRRGEQRSFALKELPNYLVLLDLVAEVTRPGGLGRAPND